MNRWFWQSRIRNRSFLSRQPGAQSFVELLMHLCAMTINSMLVYLAWLRFLLKRRSTSKVTSKTTEQSWLRCRKKRGLPPYAFGKAIDGMHLLIFGRFQRGEAILC